MSIHYCLVEDGCHLPLDRPTAKSALGWLKHRRAKYQITRRRTRFGRPAIDITVQLGGAR